MNPTGIGSVFLRAARTLPNPSRGFSASLKHYIPMADKADKKEEEAIRRFAEITHTNEALGHSILQDVDYDLAEALAIYYAGSDGTVKKSAPSVLASGGITGVGRATGASSEEPSEKRHRTGEDEIPSELTFVSYNVDGLDEVNLNRRFTAVLVIIARINPEVIFLQEVVDDMVPQIISLLDRMYHIFYSKAAEPYYTATMVSKNMEILRHEVVPFGNSIMGRSMLVVEAQWNKLRLNLINTHLENMKEHSEKRKLQFAQCIKRMKLPHEVDDDSDFMTIFGGDLNIRDEEVSPEVDGKAIRDAWIEAGCNLLTKFTWDKVLNDNKKDGFKHRCRFDRVYFTGGPYKKVDFSLHGKERIRQIHCFPSDHFAVCCRFYSPEKADSVDGKEGENG